MNTVKVTCSKCGAVFEAFNDEEDCYCFNCGAKVNKNGECIDAISDNRSVVEELTNNSLDLIENGQYEEANKVIETVLNTTPEYSPANILSLMCVYHVSKMQDLTYAPELLKTNKKFSLAMENAKDENEASFYKTIEEDNEKKYFDYINRATTLDSKSLFARKLILLTFGMLILILYIPFSVIPLLFIGGGIQLIIVWQYVQRTKQLNTIVAEYSEHGFKATDIPLPDEMMGLPIGDGHQIGTHGTADERGNIGGEVTVVNGDKKAEYWLRCSGVPNVLKIDAAGIASNAVNIKNAYQSIHSSIFFLFFRRLLSDSSAKRYTKSKNVLRQMKTGEISLHLKFGTDVSNMMISPQYLERIVASKKLGLTAHSNIVQDCKYCRFAITNDSFPFSSDSKMMAIKVSKGTILIVGNLLIANMNGEITVHEFDRTSVSTSYMQFADNNMPSDAVEVGRRWQHERVNGQRDKRYKNNISFPVYKLGVLKICCKDSKVIEIIYSNTK